MPAAAKLKALWRCPECGERFVTKNLWHSCGRFSLEQLFARSESHVIELFKSFAQMVRKCGPARMIPQKNRAVFQVRMRFASCYPRRSSMVCTLALSRLLENPRIIKVEHFSPHCILHYFRITSKDDLDSELQRWLRESYKVGAQSQLSRSKKQTSRAAKKGTAA